MNVTTDQLNNMRGKIDTSKKDTKLCKQIAAHIAADTRRSNYLNSKGEALAGDLKKHITDKSQIPQAFKEAFEMLHSQ